MADLCQFLRSLYPPFADMMRGQDAQHMADIAFFIGLDHVSSEQLESVFSAVVIPDLTELREAFKRAKPRVCELASKV